MKFEKPSDVKVLYLGTPKIAIYPLLALLEEGFNKFYVYTNDRDSGIRHALMDDEGTYVPSKDEAYFMLVSCSAFINYLRRKVAE